MSKTFRVRLAVSLVAVAAGLGAVAVPASASVSPSATAARDSVPPAARVVKVERPTYAPVRESVSAFLAKAARDGHPLSAQVARQLSVSPASTSCWYWNDWRKGTNVFGATMWQFNVEPNWCGDGTWIRSHAYTNTWGTTSWLGWEYKGVIQSSDHYGVNWNIYEAIRQGSFCYINFYSCVQNQYPYVDVEVGARGQVIKS